VLSRLERMRLNPLRRRTNRSHGEHLSGKGGTSIEFSDYRDYVSGDDLRHVDWNGLLAAAPPVPSSNFATKSR